MSAKSDFKNLIDILHEKIDITVESIKNKTQQLPLITRTQALKAYIDENKSVEEMKADLKVMMDKLG